MDTSTTQYPIYGPSRLPGFSAYEDFPANPMKSFKIISNGKKETIESVKYRFKYFEYLNKNN